MCKHIHRRYTRPGCKQPQACGSGEPGPATHPPPQASPASSQEEVEPEAVPARSTCEAHRLLDAGLPWGSLQNPVLTQALARMGCPALPCAHCPSNLSTFCPGPAVLDIGSVLRQPPRARPVSPPPSPGAPAAHGGACREAGAGSFAWSCLPSPPGRPPWARRQPPSWGPGTAVCPSPSATRPCTNSPAGHCEVPSRLLTAPAASPRNTHFSAQF